MNKDNKRFYLSFVGVPACMSAVFFAAHWLESPEIYQGQMLATGIGLGLSAVVMSILIEVFNVKL